MSNDETPTYATAEAVAGLAAEVESLRRRMEPLQKLPGQVSDLAGQVSRVAEDVVRSTAKPTPASVPSWLTLPADPDLAREVLQDLIAWMNAVFLRYSDAAAALPECWAWHPDLIEELLWLREAWSTAYEGESASVALAGDWHDRYRPGVVRRIRTTVGNCSLENHTPSTGPTSAPLAGAVEPIAHWWATDREASAPEPTEEQFAAVSPRRRPGGVRR